MLRHILNYFRRSASSKVAVRSAGRVITLSPEHIGPRRSCDAEIARADFEPTGLEDAPQETLVRICEEYWACLNQPPFEEIKDPAERVNAMIDEALSTEGTQRRNTYVLATNELGARGSEILEWARRQLSHPDYEAREMAAWWIGQLGTRDQLGSDVEEVIDELGALANRPVGEENKERQAIDGAVMAIGKTGHRKGIAVLRGVLFSTEWYHEDDTKWNAADALGKLVGQSFMDQADPVESARQWLENNIEPTVA